jgi:hypothetical protein
LYDASPMRALYAVLVALLLIASASPAFGWTASTRIVMIDDAIKLMPTSLRSVLEKRRSDVLRGMLEPLTREDTPPHRPPWDGGSIETSVDAAARDLVAGVSTRVPFKDVARNFGVLAHFVADTGFPPGAAGAAGAPRYAHFAALCETRRPRFPFVFYGHGNAALSKGDFKLFTLTILERARAEDVTLARAYAQAGSENNAAAFDDRSVPFAVASLSYSRTVTDIVQAWLTVWAQCHGDLGGTPYQGAK